MEEVEGGSDRFKGDNIRTVQGDNIRGFGLSVFVYAEELTKHSAVVCEFLCLLVSCCLVVR